MQIDRLCNADLEQGKYTVFADAYTVDDKHIVCFEATVQFS